MILPFTIVQLVLACTTGLLCVVLGLVGRRPNDLTVLALALVELVLIAQLVVAIVAPGAGNPPTGSLLEFWLYLGTAVIIPPLAIRGPAITIRRFNARVFEPADLLRLGTASPPMLEFLGVCVRSRRNIVVSGGTGSGKTTLLNVLSNLIGDGERIVTIEDAAELRLRHAHIVALESRPPNTEGRGQVTIRDLVRNALRMRPDRIIVGECRGGEALDMLQAMNTGHDGSLTTVHANSPRDVVARLEVMVLMAGVDIPVQAIREQIASAVDIVVQQARQADGVRRITEITEVTGMEGGRIQMQPIFRLDHARLAGGRVATSFVACGHVPSFYDALADTGMALDYGLFREAASP